jgi:capsular exopolysaccharide synthesis family protein
MSRFYDVLKGTRQPDRPSPKDVDAVGSETLRPSDVADFLATFNETAPSDENPAPADFAGPLAHAAETVELPEEPVHEDLRQVESPSPSRSGLANRAFGRLIEARLDERIRLIPNLLDSMNVEQYRLLRTKLLQQQADRMFRTLLVTSARVGEGKTLTTMNLALTFAMLPSFRVLVVEGDLRKGIMQDLLRMQDHPGFGNLIEGSATLEQVVFRSSDLPVWFVTRGNSRVSPAELLHSPQVGLQLREMAKRFDLVLVDSPPVNLVADAQLLAASCESVLLVVRACFTTQAELEEATKKLRRFQVIGTVLNGTQRMVQNFGYDYYKD